MPAQSANHLKPSGQCTPVPSRSSTLRDSEESWPFKTDKTEYAIQGNTLLRECTTQTKQCGYALSRHIKQSWTSTNYAPSSHAQTHEITPTQTDTESDRCRCRRRNGHRCTNLPRQLARSAEARLRQLEDAGNGRKSSPEGEGQGAREMGQKTWAESRFRSG